MSFASDAASAREAHENYFGGKILCVPPVGNGISVSATIHAEEVGSKRTSSGTVNVITRLVTIRKTLLPSGFNQQSWNVSIGGVVYAINRMSVNGSGRTMVYLERTTSNEVSRPAYRGPRS